MKYDDMIPEIAYYTAIYIFVIQFLFIQLYPEVVAIYNFLSFGNIFVWQGMLFGISMLYIPSAWFFFEKHFRLHTELASMLTLRKRYDYLVIIKKFLTDLKIENNDERIKLKSNQILDEVFYPYFSFYLDNPLDKHLISEVGRRLQFYWITQNTLLFTLIFTLLGMIISFSINILILILFVNILMVFIAIKRLIEKSKEEVSVILSESNRRRKVKKRLLEILDAL